METPPTHAPHGWRSWLPRVLAESVLIVFSVLLALAVDQWREDREVAREVREAREAFAREMRGNRDLLTTAPYHAHHKNMWAHYRALADAADAQDAPRLAELHRVTLAEFSNGVWPTPLRDAVWRSLSQSEILRHMRSAEVFLLADAYQEQERLERWHNRFFDASSMPTADNENPEFKRSKIHTTRSYLADVVAAEQRLLKSYAEVLAELEKPQQN
jgi:hypothetical protein